MRARGGILSSFSYVAADLADMAWFPLDSGVTGQYLPCSVTGQYHKMARKSSPLWRPQSGRSQVMSLQEAIALQNPALARTQEPNSLFSPYRLGDLELSNRLVVSPMTRS